MKIPEAIEILTTQANFAWKVDNQPAADACQLGIEALKRLKEAREWSPLFGQPLLPGETK